MSQQKVSHHQFSEVDLLFGNFNFDIYHSFAVRYGEKKSAERKNLKLKKNL
jgi:hypothetical protein